MARTHGLSFEAWQRLLPQYLGRLGSGSGGFEAAARGQGATLQRADLDFDAQDVMTQLTDEPSVKFDEIAGAFTVVHAGDRWTLAGRRVIAVRAGRRDPDSDFDVSWRGEAGLLELHAKASYLRADTLLPLAGLLPQKNLRERLQEAAPTGEWRDLHVDLQRASLGEPLRFELRARFEGVGFAPAGRAPGLRGLSGSVAGTQDGGRVDIDTSRAVFTWPSEFPQPIPLEHLETTLFWRHTPEELLVATPAIELQTADVSLKAKLAWHRPSDGTSPVIVLAAEVNDGIVANTKLYLPRLLIAPAALTWLNEALPAGRMTHADVVLNGPVRNYPFRDGSGLFLARAHIEGLTLDYKEGWPAADHLALLAEFRNEGMTLQFTGGRIGNLVVERGTARFADLKTGELRVRTTVSGDAADALTYLRATPLDAATDHVFSAVTASGPLQADVDLFLPFKEFDRRHTLVQAHLQGVSLSRTGSPLVATELTGDADVDGAQVSRADVHGSVLGGTFEMQARAPRNRPVTRTILVFNGNLSGEALHSALSLPASIPIDGATDWHGVLRMAPEPARERSLRLNGSLTGLGFDLPEPLAKPIGMPLPSSLEVLWPASGGEQLRVTLGSVLRGQLALESDREGLKLGKAAVAFGSGPASAEQPPYSDIQRVNTSGTIGRLDLAGWLKLYTPDKNARPITDFMRSAQFEVSELDYLGLAFRDVSVDLALNDSGWRIGVGGPNVMGSIGMPSPADPGRPWKLEFQQLHFTDSSGVASGAGTTALVAADSAGNSLGNPHGIPAIDFHAADLAWDGRQFGDVHATLARLDDGIALEQLSATGASFSATAQGQWRGRNVGLAGVAGTVTSTDVGAALKELGADAVIEAKTGKVDFDLHWVGAPTADALSEATGRVQVTLDKGQLTGIKPGAGRVVGLASLASIPRRLELDFSDLTDKGLAFDTIRGGFDLRDGSAYSDDVLVKGPAAEIGLIGRVGLKNRDYDQTAVVTGNVSTTLPLAAFAAGPIVGGAVLLFSQVFKQPLKGLARGYYRITGGWDNPTVERIKSADAAAATAEAPK